MNVTYKSLAEVLRATTCANEPLVFSLSQENTSLTSGLFLVPGSQNGTHGAEMLAMTHRPQHKNMFVVLSY